MRNHTRQKYIRTSRIPNKWANFDAQPAHVRAWLRDHALNIWPGDYRDLTPVMASTDRNHLLGLESVWGPDHPAVQDAKRKVVARRGKAQALLTTEDLENFF